MDNQKNFNVIYFAWVVNLIAMCGSLFYSDVLEYPPCTLCWYQRICVYPMVILLSVGFLRKDRNVAYYALPLSIIGWIISFYHNLLYFKIIPEAIKTCTSGVSCTSKQVEYLGFVTIPLMSFACLTITIICLIHFLRKTKE